MALPYKVIEISGEYKIKEMTTEQYVASYATAAAAKEHCKKLNLGCGFDSHTPKFIAEYVDNKEKDIL